VFPSSLESYICNASSSSLALQALVLLFELEALITVFSQGSVCFLKVFFVDPYFKALPSYSIIFIGVIA